MPEDTLVERWSPWYVVRGVGSSLLIALFLWLLMPPLGRALIHLPSGVVDRLGEGPLTVALMVGSWTYTLAPFVALAVIVIGVARTLLGGIRREYRLESGVLSARRSTFSRIRTVDLTKVTGVEARVGVVSRLFHGGSVRVSTDGRSVNLKAVSNPERWADALRPGTAR